MLPPRLAVFSLFVILLCPATTLADDKWVELRTPNFTLVSNAGEKDTRQIAFELEQIRAILSVAIDQPRGEGAPVTVIVTDTKDFLQRLLIPGGKAVWDWDLVGLAASSPENYYLALKPLHPIGARTSDIYTPTTFAITPISFQIYAGRFVRLSYGLLPLWLDVGLKQFYGSTVFVKDDIHVGALNPHRQDAVYLQKKLPLETLLSTTRDTVMDATRAEQFKNQCEALVHYLTFADDLPKRRPIREIIDLIRNGADSVDAVQKSVGDLKQLQRRLERYLRREELLQARITPPATVNVRDLPLREVPRAELAALLGNLLQSEWWEVYLHPGDGPDSLSQSARLAMEATHKMRHAAKPTISLSSREFMLLARDSELQTQRISRAREYFEEAARLDSGLLPVQIAMGRRLYLDGNRAAARDWLQKAIMASPQSHLGHYYLGRTFAEEPENNPEMVTKAASAYRRAIAAQPRFAPAYDGLAKLMERSGNVEEATRLSHRSLELDLSNPSYFVTISRLLLRSNQPDLARLAARQAVAGTEDDAERKLAQTILAEATARLATQPAAASQSAKQPPQ